MLPKALDELKSATLSRMLEPAANASAVRNHPASICPYLEGRHEATFYKPCGMRDR
jgi:hypothetical protein